MPLARLLRWRGKEMLFIFMCASVVLTSLVIIQLLEDVIHCSELAIYSWRQCLISSWDRKEPTVRWCTQEIIRNCSFIITHYWRDYFYNIVCWETCFTWFQLSFCGSSSLNLTLAQNQLGSQKWRRFRRNPQVPYFKRVFVTKPGKPHVPEISVLHRLHTSNR